MDKNGALDKVRWRMVDEDVDLSGADRKRIEWRAGMISRRHEAANGVGHLEVSGREKPGALREGVMLAELPGEHRAVEPAAALHAGFPRAAPATEIVWHAMRRPARSGDPGLPIPPNLPGPLSSSIMRSSPEAPSTNGKTAAR